MAKASFGQHVADAVANTVGSWPFIITQSLILTVWITWNTYLPKKYKFDPQPFILMNLLLSTQAAFATPLILMSQKRQSEIDRQRDIETHEHARNTLVGTIQLIDELEELEKKLSIIETDIQEIS